MRAHPTAFAWIDPAIDPWSELEDTRIRALARQLGYRLYRPEPSVLPLVDQVRSADVDAVITPSPIHLDIIQLHTLMHMVDIETAEPRISFARRTTCPCQTRQA
ncbi:hypothetical protein BJY24_003326 [Nocardia transvalensis]|uniref:Gfo/Idh/MocA-like oxidoreductase N-terminal domain-containing protein n=1 Tax=Nocardia transvalensis TaxID=37333 RepID=A0A7W9PF33_9NOCA|nr:hypothetical protein [Nocardia transvalensis]MBB5914459.1 hypothetical protein [Nocardia transvalensis]